MSHLEAWDVRRTLTRVFGIGGWDQELLSTELVHSIGAMRRRKDKEGVEYGDPYEAWTVVYAVTLRLVVKDGNGIPICHFDEGASGDSVNQPSVGDAHDMALKTAISQALKRAAVNLGDQFGLSLYNNGSTKQVVHRTLVPPAEAAQPGEPTDLPVEQVQAEPSPEPRQIYNQHEPVGASR
jgi:recombination DNA repair RAD52 pathway protein